MLEDELTAISEKTKKATQYIAMLKDQLKRQSLRAHQLKNLKDQVHNKLLLLGLISKIVKPYFILTQWPA